MVITLLSLTLIISCLQGAITEASTSNSAELKKEKKTEKYAGSTSAHTQCQEKKEMKYLLLIASEEDKLCVRS